MDEEEIQMRSTVLKMVLNEEQVKKKNRVISDEDRERNQKIVDEWFRGLIGK